MKIFRSTLSDIVNDHTHGSGRLVRDLIVATADFLHRHPQLTQSEWETFRREIRTIADELSSFVAVQTYCQMLPAQLQTEAPSSAQLLESVNQFQKSLDTFRDGQVKWLKELNLSGKTVLTHSHSTTVIFCLSELQADDRPGIIYQTESLPGGEGRVQAKDLRKAGYSVELISDSKVELIIKKTNVVLLGADGIGTKYFSNKVGSAAIARLAQRASVPVYVLSDPTKRLTVDIPVIASPVLEPVENSLVTKFIWGSELT